MSSCNRGYSIMNYPICSGHGECVDNQCLCFSGWTGLSDFALEKGFDCDINILLVKIWSGINLALASISAIIIIICMTNDSTLSVEKRYKTKSLCFMAFLMMNLSSIIYTCGKTVDPTEYIVGHSIVTSISGAGIVVFTMQGISTFFIIIIRFLKSYSRMLDQSTKERVNRHFELLVFLTPIVNHVLSIIGTIVVIVSLIIPPKDSDKANIAQCLTLMVGYLYSASTVIYVLNNFLKEISIFLDSPVNQNNHNSNFQSSSKSSNISDIKQIYDKVKLANHFISPFLINGAPLNILFVSWFFIRRKVTFLLLLQLTLVTTMSAVLVWSLTSIKSKKLNNRLSSHKISSYKLSSHKLPKVVGSSSWISNNNNNESSNNSGSNHISMKISSFKLTTSNLFSNTKITPDRLQGCIRQKVSSNLIVVSASNQDAASV